MDSDTLEIEEWRPIDGWPHYEVSNFGRVRSWKKRGNGFGKTLEKPIILKQGTSRNGYKTVRPCQNKVPKTFSVHCLVLEAFVGQRPSAVHQAAHFDGDPSNNRLDNLRWATRVENAADRIRHGRQVRGENHPLSKLTEGKVREIRRSSEGSTRLAERFNVSQKAIDLVLSGEKWAHVK